jgi:GT2 family glycosyltransferase
MNSVEISVIIPTYRRERQLLEAVGSVLCQRSVSFEIIVVDDSADGEAQAPVKLLADPRIRYLRRPEPSQGRPALVRNQGAQVAAGRYLYFLDDDDLLEADTLETLSKALDAAPHAGVAFGVVAPFGTDAHVLRRQEESFIAARRVARKLKGRRQLSAYLTFRDTILICSACMWRRSAFESEGGFDAAIPICEDTELAARVALATDYVFVDKPVVRYRTGAPSLMHSLAPDDDKLHVSYRRIQTKYRRANGWFWYVATKVWARLV